MSVAYELHKFEGEVLELDPDELARWIAFFKIRSKEHEKAMKKAQNKVKVRRK